jgi:hypothetical protein
MFRWIAGLNLRGIDKEDIKTSSSLTICRVT